MCQAGGYATACTVHRVHRQEDQPNHGGAVPAHLQRSDFLVDGCGRHTPEQSNKLGVVARVIASRQERREAVATALTYTPM